MLGFGITEIFFLLMLAGLLFSGKDYKTAMATLYTWWQKLENVKQETKSLVNDVKREAIFAKHSLDAIQQETKVAINMVSIPDSNTATTNTGLTTNKSQTENIP
jgi:Sec-independent protein translocase protein TatA